METDVREAFEHIAGKPMTTTTDGILKQALYAAAAATDEVVPGQGQHMRKFADEIESRRPPAETKEAKIARLEAAGIIFPECSGCRYWYEHPSADPMAPRHNASSRCESGKRPHCSCDVCF